MGGKFTLKNAEIKLGSSVHPANISNFVKEITLTYRSESLDKTACGSFGRKRISGLKDWNSKLILNQSFALSGPDISLWNMLGSTANWLSVKLNSSQVNDGNPRYYGKFLLRSYVPISGSIGTLAISNAEIIGDGVLIRSSTPIAYEGTSLTARCTEGDSWTRWGKLYDLFNASVAVSTTWEGSVTVQRKFGSTGSENDVSSFSTNTETVGIEPEDGTYYRIGIKTGNYTAGYANVRLSQ